MRSRSIVAALALCAPSLPAQERPRATDTVTVAAGAHYRAGAFHRFLFGSDYRALWTTRVAVPVLHLGLTGDGLAPTTAGGGLQTKSLRFDGANGQRYGFRSVDKDPDVLRPELRGTVVEDLVQDQISSAHPAGPAIATVLMEAAGILHTDPWLTVLPDDPGLNEHRERFASTLGFFAERAVTDQAQPFAGATEIIDGDEIFERVRRSPDDRVDSRAFLNARLLDLLIGDWDRHRGQWTWARFGESVPRCWIAVPEDRDQAFVRYDGLMLGFARITAPQLVNFGPDYPGMLGLTWNGREVDRHFLTDLAKPVWDSVALALQARLTDSVIAAAVAAMPPEYQMIDGDRMNRVLRSRRDRLPEAADAFYRLLAREPAVHATHRPEVITVERGRDGVVEVAVRTADVPGDAPYFRRRFDPHETSEIRLFLHDGDDRVVVRGEGEGITLRVVSGEGRDVVLDSSRAGGVRLYTTDGDSAAGPSGGAIDRRPYRPPAHLQPPRDWGDRWRGVAWASFGPDIGLFLGGGGYRMTFGFRHFPYASRARVRAGYATEARTGRAELLAQFTRANSRVRFELEATASGIEVIRFHGFGNETVLERPDDDAFYRVNQEQYTLEPRVVLPVGPRAELQTGPTATYASTADRPSRFLASLGDVYGAGEFGQLGAHASFTLDTRDVPAAATRGVHVTLGGGFFPEAWDVEDAFGEVHGTASTYLSAAGAPLRPTVAMRIGGKKVWGTAPFHQAAFLGDAASVRLGRKNRFAGDASAFGNAELRLRLTDVFLVLPAELGVFGLGDVGRVFLDGETSGIWHNAVGGGVWLAFLGPGGTISAAVTRSEIGRGVADQRTGIYVQAGFAF